MNISSKYFHAVMPHPHCTSPICQLEDQWNTRGENKF